MTMQKYVFLGSLLPSLKLGEEPDLSFDELSNLFEMNLSFSDLEKIAVIRRYIDLQNVKRLLQNVAFDLKGNLTEKEIDRALVSREGLPCYLFDFLDKYSTAEEQIRYFSKVLFQFFNDPFQKKGDFLTFYLDFEWQWRVALAEYRAKSLKRRSTLDLLFEETQDLFFQEVLTQREKDRFEFPYEFQDLEEHLQRVDKDPMRYYEEMACFRFCRMQEWMNKKPFSLDFVLAYLVQFLIIEDQKRLSEENGGKLLTALLENVG